MRFFQPDSTKVSWHGCWRKAHDIVTLSFCNIVKGQANWLIIWLKKYVFKKWVDFSEKIQQYETKIGEFEKQLFVLILFPNNEQLFSMTNNKYSGTNKKHRYCIWYLLERGESPIYF